MAEDPKTITPLSVQDRAEQALQEESPIVWWIGQLADEIPPEKGLQRDRALDSFWRQESILAGAVYSMIAKVAALDFKLKGDPKAVAYYRRILQSADFGGGWVTFIMKVVQDYLVGDNGAAIEVMRPKGAPPTSRVAAIAHLDAQRIRRTGNPEIPALYWSQDDQSYHRLRWYEVLSLIDQPSPREDDKGMGLSAVSRAAQAAKILRDVGLYKRQKLGGKRVPALLFVQGIRQNAIESAMLKAKEGASSQGYSHYMGPVILSSHDTNRAVDAKLIELASLPDGYNEDILYKWYIATLALDFGTDYTEFAPLPGGNLGSAQQTTEMAARARGKGPGVLLQQIEFGLNWWVLPPSVEFQFASTDPTAERERIELMERRGRTYGNLVQQLILTPEQARQMLAENGDIPETFVTGDAVEDRVETIVKSLDAIEAAYTTVEKALCRAGRSDSASR